MCTTCDSTKFEGKVSTDERVEKLEHRLGFGSLVIRCDMDGKNYTLGVKDEPKSDYKIYRCPTCGKKFY